VDLSLADGEIQTVERAGAAEVLDQAANADDIGHGFILLTIQYLLNDLILL
jgi:hypothetical protein